MWGSFPEVTSQPARIYLRAYWRFLLGWGMPPARGNLDPDQLRELRRWARMEVTDYQSFAVLAQREGGATVYEYPKIRPPPP